MRKGLQRLVIICHVKIRYSHDAEEIVDSLSTNDSAQQNGLTVKKKNNEMGIKNPDPNTKK